MDDICKSVCSDSESQSVTHGQMKHCWKLKCQPQTEMSSESERNVVKNHIENKQEISISIFILLRMILPLYVSVYKKYQYFDMFWALDNGGHLHLIAIVIYH